MTRLLIAVFIALSGCTGFRSVERGEWQRVWADAGRRTADAPQAFITKEDYGIETTAGTHREWTPPPGYRPTRLETLERLSLKLHDVFEIRIDEEHPVELDVQGSAVSLYWNPVLVLDEWKDGDAHTTRESHVWLVAKSEGQATLRVTRGTTVKELVVSVSP